MPNGHRRRRQQRPREQKRPSRAGLFLMPGRKVDVGSAASDSGRSMRSRYRPDGARQVRVFVAGATSQLELALAPPVEPRRARRMAVVLDGTDQRIAQVIVVVAPNLAKLALPEAGLDAPRGVARVGEVQCLAGARPRAEEAIQLAEGLDRLTGSHEARLDLAVVVRVGVPPTPRPRDAGSARRPTFRTPRHDGCDERAR